MRYVIGVLSAIIVVLLLVALVFGRGNKDQSATTTPAALTSYAETNSSIVFTTYGRLVGEQQRQAVRIVVTPVERRLEVLSGYEETITSTQSFSNNSEAYANFLSAMQVAGFDDARKSSITDPRGVCPTGNRFQYNLYENDDTKVDLWSVSCSAGTGTLAGRASVIRDLFQRQIPDYSGLTRSVTL